MISSAVNRDTVPIFYLLCIGTPKPKVFPDYRKILSIGGRLYIYDPPCWRLIDGDDLMEFVSTTVKCIFPKEAPFLDERQRQEISRQLLYQSKKLKKIPTIDHNYLCCQDGMYNWHTGEYTQHKSSPVTKTIRLPKYETVTKKEAFSQEEYDIAFAFAARHPSGLGIMFLMETGVSRSELLGPRWEDLDLENGTVTISQGLVSFYDDEQEQWTTSADGLKNKYRHRTIPLVNTELLEQLREKPREIIPPGRKNPVQTEYVFHSPSGKPYQPNNWANRVYRPFMKDLLAAHPELPDLSAHELRHTGDPVSGPGRGPAHGDPAAGPL